MCQSFACLEQTHSMQTYDYQHPCTTPKPCFTPFCLNTPCQFTPLLNLHPLNFGLMPFGWPRSIKLTAYFWQEYYFLFMLTFPGIQLWHKTRARCIWLLSNQNTYRLQLQQHYNLLQASASCNSKCPHITQILLYIIFRASNWNELNSKQRIIPDIH